MLLSCSAAGHDGAVAGACGALLTSNEVILGIKGVDHPLLDYQEAHLPTVLASDDEGAQTSASSSS
jgi:hypothetical protein